MPVIILGAKDVTIKDRQGPHIQGAYFVVETAGEDQKQMNKNKIILNNIKCHEENKTEYWDRE